jgi:pyruvyltransferase
MTKLFWWNRVPNLGDSLSWLILGGYGRTVEWAPPETAEMVGIGSVLGWFDGFTGTVWGTGRGGDELPPHDLTHATVKALRGRETQKLVKGGDGAVLGDPGLLISDFVEPDPQGYTAVVAHFQDQDRMSALYKDDVIVDVTASAAEGIKTISHAERVVSSSLHGIVLADAFGLPRKWDYFEGSLGGGFKFKDYASVMGDFAPDEWRRAHPKLVDVVRSELRECL